MITTWEWDTTVAAWRYYDGRLSIGGGTFPCEFVEHFWGAGNGYSDEDRLGLARQFVETDYHSPKYPAAFKDAQWRRLWAFLSAYIKGPQKVHARENPSAEEVVIECFNLDGEFYPMDQFKTNPYVCCRLRKECIVSVEGKLHGANHTQFQAEDHGREGQHYSNSRNRVSRPGSRKEPHAENSEDSGRAVGH